jgi:hypothetical protein
MVALGVLGLFLVGFLFAVPADALPTNEVEIFYLDENGIVVGYYFRGCSGERLRDGVITESLMRYSAACSNPPGGSVSCIWEGIYTTCAQNMFWELCTVYYPPELCEIP